MRLTLLLICLFSLAGGCFASSSHGVVVPKIVACSGKNQATLATAAILKQHNGGSDLTAAFADADDMEDDEDIDHPVVRKWKMPVTYLHPYTHSFLTLNSLRCCRLSVVSMLGNSSPRYIAQQVFRI